jgi:hypothetical protein
LFIITDISLSVCVGGHFSLLPVISLDFIEKFTVARPKQGEIERSVAIGSVPMEF